jgi:hypothetical protein
MEAEKALLQVTQAHQAAQTATEQAPDEEHQRVAAEALAKVAPAEQAVAEKQGALEAAEKTLAEASGAVEAAKASLDRLNAAAKHWSAAAVNAQAIAIRREAADADVALEEQLAGFTESSTALTTRADLVNAKRAEREQLASGFKTPPTPEVLAELEATLTALDITVEREVQALAKAEDEAIARRVELEMAAASNRGKSLESAALKTAYQHLRE